MLNNNAHTEKEIPEIAQLNVRLLTNYNPQGISKIHTMGKLLLLCFNQHLIV